MDQNHSTTDTSAQCASSPTETKLNVKEVAAKLGKSLSTVYRIDRYFGPFKFIIKGRRIFVDTESLANYLDCQSAEEDSPDHRKRASVSSEKVACPTVQASKNTEQFTLMPSAAESTQSSGQRDLILRAEQQC